MLAGLIFFFYKTCILYFYKNLQKLLLLRGQCQFITHPNASHLPTVKMSALTEVITFASGQLIKGIWLLALGCYLLLNSHGSSKFVHNFSHDCMGRVAQTYSEQIQRETFKTQIAGRTNIIQFDNSKRARDIFKGCIVCNFITTLKSRVKL